MPPKSHSDDTAQPPDNVDVPKQKTPTKTQLARTSRTLVEVKLSSPADAAH